DGEVVVLAAEDAVGRDLDLDEQVAGRTAVVAGCALALEPDPRAVLDPGRDAGLDGARRGAATAAVAGRAGLVVHQLASATGGAGLVDGERPARAGHDESRALALRADVRAGAGLPAGALAGRAGGVGGQPQRHRHAVERVGEADRRRALDVGAPAGPGLL